MGVAAAVMRGTFVDPLLMMLGLIGISMPVFWLGEVINLITQSRLHDAAVLLGAAARLHAVHLETRWAGSSTWCSPG